MTPLRLRMTEEMRTAGLAAGTQAVYIDGVRRLAKHVDRLPTLTPYITSVRTCFLTAFSPLIRVNVGWWC